MPGTTQSWRDEWRSRRGCERKLRVRWLLNPNEPPLENVELVEQNGVITDIRRLASPCAVEWAVMIPTLVNAHTHLEFSSLTEPIRPALPFQSWISSVIKWRRNAESSCGDAIQRGLAESQASGVMTVGEITTTAPVPSEHLSPGSKVVSFREIIGLQRDRIPELMRVAEQHLGVFDPIGSDPTGSDGSVIGGISPHAPYTVHPDLFEALIDLAATHNAVVAMHLAETTDELQLLQNGDGAFAEFLQTLGLWDSSTFPGGRSIREFIERLVAAPRALAIHGNYFSEDDIGFVARHANIATVYCARTHAFFGHTQYSIRQMLTAGARVLLGTDSRASNPDLSLWKEVQFCARHFPDIAVPRLLAMVTTDAADALGFPTAHYQIHQGAELRCVLLKSDCRPNNLLQLIQHPSTEPEVVLIESDG